MGGKGASFGVKGKGKGKGKGKRKGKGKGQNEPQRRKELGSLVGEVMRKHGGAEDGAVTKGKGKKGKGKGKGKKGKKGEVVKSRKQERRGIRQEAKARRSHFFGEGRRKDRGVPLTGKKATEEERQDPKKTGQGKGGQKGAPNQKRRKRHDDDDEEITSDEEDGPSQKKPKTEDDEDEEVSNGEDEEIDEGEEEEQDDEDGSAEEDVDVDDENAPSATASTATATGGYVPPHLRKKAGEAGAGSAQATALKRQLRGATNKVTEGNLDPSLQEISTILTKMLAETNPAASANSLMDVLLPAAVGDPNISVLVLGCHAALATGAHLLFGPAFGGTALIQVGLWLQRRLLSCEASDEPTGEDARIAKNCVIFICLLFSFGLLGGGVVFDLVRFIFASEISEVRIELALTVLRFAGRGLRSGYTDDFKELLKFVTDAATAIRGGDSAIEGSDIRSRVEYLLKELQDLKNNKVSFAVMDRFDVTKNWLSRTPQLGGKKVSDHQLPVPFKYLGEDPPEGWPVSKTSSKMRTAARKVGTSGAKTDALRAAAVAQRLTTEVRQSIFVALMGAEDFEHAAERVAMVAAGAKTGVSDACLVIFHCVIREKIPNKFYEHVADTLCSRPAPWGKRFQHSLKQAAVQNLTQVHTYGMRAAIGLAELLAAFIALPATAVPLAVVRFIKFDVAGAGGEGSGMGGGILGLFLRHLLESLLHRLPDGTAASAAFESLRKYDDVREGLLLVLDGHVRTQAKPAAQAPAFWENMRAARKELAKRASHL